MIAIASRILAILSSVLLLLFAIFGCVTNPQPIETSTGPVAGDLFKQFLVLGMSQRSTCLVQQDGSFQTEGPFQVKVPPGTEAVFVALGGWGLAYSDSRGEPCSENWGRTPDDQHWGSGWVRVWVTNVDAATQTATLIVRAQLRDNKPDNPWTGWVNYSLLFLGHPSSARPACGRATAPQCNGVCEGGEACVADSSNRGCVCSIDIPPPPR